VAPAAARGLGQLTARDPRGGPPVDGLYRQHGTERYGPAAAEALAPLLLRFELENELGCLSSPEFYPYSPSWGRMSAALAGELGAAITLIERLEPQAGASEHRRNLAWLADNFRGSLLLDEVGRRMESAYALKEEHLRGEVAADELAQRAQAAGRDLAAAPIEKLFRMFARRVRSRGELGELSSLNQKLGLQYRELDQFLREVARTRNTMK